MFPQGVKLSSVNHQVYPPERIEMSLGIQLITDGLFREIMQNKAKNERSKLPRGGTDEGSIHPSKPPRGGTDEGSIHPLDRGRSSVYGDSLDGVSVQAQPEDQGQEPVSCTSCCTGL